MSLFKQTFDKNTHIKKERVFKGEKRQPSSSSQHCLLPPSISTTLSPSPSPSPPSLTRCLLTMEEMRVAGGVRPSLPLVNKHASKKRQALLSSLLQNEHDFIQGLSISPKKITICRNLSRMVGFLITNTPPKPVCCGGFFF